LNGTIDIFPFFFPRGLRFIVCLSVLMLLVKYRRGYDIILHSVSRKKDENSPRKLT